MAGTPDGLVSELVTLAGHLAWPGALLVVAYAARDELRRVIAAVAARVADPRSEVVIGKDGVEIRSLEAEKGKLESLQIAVDQLKELLVRPAAGAGVLAHAAGEPAVASRPVDEDLRSLADDYLRIEAQDPGERLRLKNAAARALGNLVVTSGTSRDTLAGADHEGLRLALAAAVNAFPEPADFERVMRAGAGAERLHVKYAVAVALGKVAELGVIDSRGAERVRDLLDRYESRADEALRRRVRLTRAIVEQRRRPGG